MTISNPYPRNTRQRIVDSAIDILISRNLEISATNVSMIVNEDLEYHHGLSAREVSNYMRMNPKIQQVGYKHYRNNASSGGRKRMVYEVKDDREHSR